MSVSNDNFYKPDEALHELRTQETIMNIAVDAQSALQILVDKGVVSREEVAVYRERVRNSPRYKPVLEQIDRQKRAFQTAKENPQDYLKALIQAKMDGRIK
ncbi:MAG: hypothetical protein HFG89_00420 [Dorea sp.]|jgi:hypothetical protein|nr:hypothetical protein [Dorea sp.]